MAQMNLSTKQKQAHRHREQTCGFQGGGGRGMDWEFGISRCKLVYIEWMNNKVLMEKNILKNVYMYITESLCCTAL